MFRTEMKVIKWIESHILILAVITVSVIGILIRVSFRDYQSGDYINFLLPWYRIMKGLDGFSALQNQVGDYNMIYQFLIAVITYLPIEPLYAYKILSFIFDFLLAGSVTFLVVDITPFNKKWSAFAAYTLTFLLPSVFLNSSAWTQCDSMYTCFIILTLYCALKEKYVRMMIFMGLALGFKLQAIFLLPFILFLYFMKKKFTILSIFLIPLTMIIASLPTILIGRRAIGDVFSIYFCQIDTYKDNFMNYPGVVALLADKHQSTEFWRPALMLLTVVVLALIMIWTCYKRVTFTSKNTISIAFFLTYTCVFFLPTMHERYDYAYVIIAIIIVFINWKTILPFIGLNIINGITYGSYLFGLNYNPNLLAIFNLVVYIAYGYLLFKQFVNKEDEQEILKH